jgi:hypothetical protein
MKKTTFKGLGDGVETAGVGRGAGVGAEGGKDETIKSMLSMLGFPPERIKAGIEALNGRGSQPVQAEGVGGCDDEPLMTPQEVCERLKISITSLWRLRPPSIQVMGRKRFCWREVMDYLASREAAVAQA